MEYQSNLKDVTFHCFHCSRLSLTWNATKFIQTYFWIVSDGWIKKHLTTPGYFHFMSRIMTQTNKMACAPSEDWDQPGHPPSLIRVFAVRLKKAWILSYPLSAQRRLWSDWTDAQADLSLLLAHMPFCWSCHDAALICLLSRRLYHTLCYTRTAREGRLLSFIDHAVNDFNVNWVGRSDVSVLYPGLWYIQDLYQSIQVLWLIRTS